MSIYSRCALPPGFYIYAYISHITGLPYYIGKGQGRRAWDKHRVTIPKYQFIVIMEANLTEIGAWALERRYIEFWGRLDLGTGILENKHEGGPGCSYLSGTQQGPTTGRSWFNNGVKNKLCFECPPGYTPGRTVKPTQGKHWFNNGVVSLMLPSCPDGWIPGLLPDHAKSSGRVGVRWWNNGHQQVKSSVCPTGWLPGPLPGFGNRQGRHWYNNGLEEMCSHACPGPQWIRGRIKL